MYFWWKLIHLIGVVGFMAAHGTSIAATFQIQRIREPAKVAGILQLSGATVVSFYFFTVVMLFGGIAAGIAGHWFETKYWIWVSLVLFVVVAVVMFPLARGYFRRIRKVLELIENGAELSESDFLRVLRSGQPTLIAGTGSAVILFIVYLMVMKPF